MRGFAVKRRLKVFDLIRKLVNIFPRKLYAATYKSDNLWKAEFDQE